jgi:carboxymethylenebutenolidase
MVAVPGAISDPSRVLSAETTVDSGGIPLRVHLARPAQAGTHPGIVVIHEAFGLNDHIRDVADRLANIGCDAIAPDLYTRTGAPDADHLRDVLFALSDDQAVADLEACAAHLRSLDGASGKVGAIGFCSGGRHTLLFAARSRGLDAAVPCWGGYIERATPDEMTTAARPRRVVDMLDDVRCPVYLVGGAEDANPSPQLLREVRDTLAARGVDVQLDIFDDAGHAFFADHRPNYRERAAHALWERAVAFFERTLR